MGIINKEGALYIATGMDNTGLYAGRREAMGIIKAMASQITSFDVFGGIGISAGVAFANAAKDSYNFEKEFRKNMLEVATISAQIGGSMTENMNKVVAITQQIPISAPEAAKALYQIVSAGHDGADGMHILEVSAKSAVGGLTDTATAADAITSILNSYKLSADKAEQISDQLFTTVRLGKTTFGELGHSIAQVTPIAASYGVEIDQVLAAIASLTKSGTPTAQAVTQVRASIIAASKVLGDGAFEGRTFQEALDLIAKKANGSETALRSMITEVEAQVGILALTGKNAQSAASDLDELQNSVGATESAFEKMKDEVENQLKLLTNNVHATLRPMGEAILKEVLDVAKSVNEAFANGDAKASMKLLGDLIVIVTGAFIGYKGAVLASTLAQRLNVAVLRQAVLERQMEKVALLNGMAGHQALTTAQLKQVATRKLLTSAIKTQTATLAKNAAMLLSSPYTWAAVAIAGVGYALYKYATQASAAELAQRRFNDAVDKFNQKAEARRQKIEQLLRVIQDETETEYAKIKAYEELTTLSPKLTAAYDLEKLKVLELKEANKKLNEERDKANYNNIITNINKYTQAVNSLKSAHDWTAKDITEETRKQYSGQVVSKAAKEAQKDLDIWEKALKDYEARKKEAEKNSQRIQAGEKAQTVLQRKLNLTKELAEAEANLKKLRAPESKTSDKEIDTAQKKVDETKAKLKALTGVSTKEGADILKSQTELSRSILETDLKLQESRLSILEDGRKKRLEQSDLEHKQQKAALEKEYQDTVQKYKDLKQAVPETVETTYKARLQANDEAKKTRDTKIDEDYVKERKEHEEALTAYLLSEEDKRKKAIKERYDSEREWAKKQFKGENMTKEEYEAYSAKIDTAEAEDSLNELLEKYQSYTDKRAKIEQTFAKQKEELKKSGASKETLDELSYQEEEALKAIDEQFASRQEEYQRWCNQIANMTLEKLQAVLKETKAELDKMESSGMSGNELAAQRAKVNKLEEQIKTEKTSTTPESRSIKQWQKLRSTLSDVKDEFEEIGESVGGVAGEFISAAGEITSSTLQMIDGIVLLSNNSATAMKKTSETAVEAMSTVEKASVILAVISAALQIATKIAGLFSKEDSHKKKRDGMLEEAEVMREVWDDILERQREYLSNSTGTDAKKSYEESLNILKQQEEVSRKIAQETLKIKNHSHSMDYRMWSGSYKYDGQNWRDVTGEIKELTGISVNGMQDIANMSADNLRLLRDNFIGLWSNMDETFRKQLEEIIELDDEAKKLGKDYKEALSQITFDNVKDDFLDLLSDMDTDSKDFADNFEEYMRKAILNSMVYDNYRQELEKWYEKFSLANAKDGGITPDDYEALRQEYNSIAEAALAEREKLKGMFNWNEGESSRTSEAKSGIAVSQDSINELNGNSNALLIYSSKTSESVARVKEDLAYIREIQMSGWQDVRAIKELTTEVRNHTEKLTKLSEKIEKHTGNMADELVDIKHGGLYIKK